MHPLRTLALISWILLVLAPSTAGAIVRVGGLEIPLARDVEVANGLAYVVSEGFPGSPGELRVIDVSDPREPAELGSLELPRAGGVQLEVIGEHAYVAVNLSGLHAIDVSDPTAPFEVGFLSLETAMTRMAATDGRVYLCTGFHGPRGGTVDAFLRVVDVSSPAAPALLGELPLPNIGEGLEVAGDLAYVTTTAAPFGSGALHAIDVSNPSALVEISATPTPLGRDLALAPGLAYVSGFVTSQGPVRGGFQVLDVANPLAPVEIGFVECCGNGGDVEVIDDLAYLMMERSGLRVIDVSDPTTPTPLGAIAVDGWDVEVAGGLAYVAGDIGLGVIDVSRPEKPTSLGSYIPGDANAPLSANDVELGGALAYLVTSDIPRNETGQLIVVDISEPTAPAAIGGADSGGPGLDVEVSGDLAFVAAGAAGLRVFDVSTPAVSEIGGLGVPGSAEAVEVVGDIAYVADSGRMRPSPGVSGGLRVIDVANPASPGAIGAFELGARCRRLSTLRSVGLALSGGFAYLSCRLTSEPLHALDVSDPMLPVRIGGAAAFGTGVEAEGALVWVAGTSLSALDVSAPATPELVGSARLSAEGVHVSVVDALAYVVNRLGLRVFDASDPSSPRDLGGYPIAFQGRPAGGVALANGLAYVAAGRAGLHIVDLGGEYAPVRGIGIDIQPGGDASPLNPMSRGVVPVAMFGGAGFDVADVDSTTLAFGPAGAPLAHRNGPHPKDANRDRETDLLAHFRMEESGIAFGDSEACVRGELFDGARFEGCDVIRTVPPACGMGFELALLLPGLRCLRRWRSRARASSVSAPGLGVRS